MFPLHVLETGSPCVASLASAVLGAQGNTGAPAGLAVTAYDLRTMYPFLFFPPLCYDTLSHSRSICCEHSGEGTPGEKEAGSDLQEIVVGREGHTHCTPVQQTNGRI